MPPGSPCTSDGYHIENAATQIHIRCNSTDLKPFPRRSSGLYVRGADEVMPFAEFDGRLRR